ncbi:TrfB-related DNA-binding protein [Pseudomonas sp. QL9]|uniref:TrfB-related DNA-binding protein n=1 Tax=Pseudomonas sp. QL9 TaxID=3242725 RepID=UPI003529ED6E
MKSPQYTREQWNALQPNLNKLSDRTIRMTYMVIIEGESKTKVARAHQTTPQNVWQAVRRVLRILESNREAICDGGVISFQDAPNQLPKTMRPMIIGELRHDAPKDLLREQLDYLVREYQSQTHRSPAEPL